MQAEHETKSSSTTATGSGTGHGSGRGAVMRSALRDRGFAEQVQMLAPRGGRRAVQRLEGDGGDAPATDEVKAEPQGDAPAGAPKLEVANDLAAPAGGKARTTVGIGEKSYIDADQDGGKWTSTGGSGTLNNGAAYSYAWVAPETVGSYTITYTVGAKSASVTMKVEAPSGIKGKKTSEYAYKASEPGSGMLLDLITEPTTVSFCNLNWLEEQGAITGEGSLKDKQPTIKHNTAWSPMGTKNDIQDKAEMSSPKPWDVGKATYEIKEKYRVGTGGTPTQYTVLNQEFEIFDKDGTMQTRKAGEFSDKRKPS